MKTKKLKVRADFTVVVDEAIDNFTASQQVWHNIKEHGYDVSTVKIVGEEPSDEQSQSNS